MSARWRSARKCSAPSIPIRQRASAISRSCIRPRVILRGRSRSMSARWRSARKRGPEHPDTAQIFNRLGFLLQAQGEYGGARRLYERALAIREKMLGPEHPHTATSLTDLAALLQAQGDPPGARPLAERALAI